MKKLLFQKVKALCEEHLQSIPPCKAVMLSPCIRGIYHVRCLSLLPRVFCLFILSLENSKGTSKCQLVDYECVIHCEGFSDVQNFGDGYSCILME